MTGRKIGNRTARDREIKSVKSSLVTSRNRVRCLNRGTSCTICHSPRARNTDTGLQMIADYSFVFIGHYVVEIIIITSAPLAVFARFSRPADDYIFVLSHFDRAVCYNTVIELSNRRRISPPPPPKKKKKISPHQSCSRFYARRPECNDIVRDNGFAIGARNQQRSARSH